MCIRDRNYPITDYYKIDKLITELGIGEALVTALSEKGNPTPLVHTLLRAPQSRMDVLNEVEIKDILSRSKIVEKYNEVIDRESAYEILNGKIEDFKKEEHQEELKKQKSKTSGGKVGRPRKSTFEKVSGEIGRTVAKELTRGLLGVLGIKTTRRRSRKSGWF